MQYRRLLEVDADLAEGIPLFERAEAIRRTVVTRIEIPAGPFDPARQVPPYGAPFALMVGHGLLVRDLQLDARVSSQLVGPGDVLRLTHDDSVALVGRAAVPSELFIVGELFLRAAARWPSLIAQFVDRTAQWAERGLWLQAISNLPRVEDRLQRLFEHLATRWGRMTPGGVLIELRLTHQALGQLIGAERPTVSLALKELDRRGTVRRHDRGWLMPSALGQAHSTSRTANPSGA